MPFPILTSLVALPTIGALVLLFVRNDEQNDRLVRGVALTVSLLVFMETLLLPSAWTASACCSSC